MSGLELRSHDIDRAILSVHRTIPNAAAESCDVNHFRVLGVGDDAMSPLEIEAWYARPMLAPVGAHPGRRLKPRSMKMVRIPRIYRDVVDVAIAFQHLPPGLACIFRQEDASTVAVFAFIPSPR